LHYRAFVDTRDGVLPNRSPAALSFRYPADQGTERDQHPHAIHRWTFRFEAQTQPPHQIHQENAVAELEQGLRLRDKRGSSHLKFAAEAGLAIAKFHYHLLLDELTNEI
jgi:hypothetical protein